MRIRAERHENDRRGRCTAPRWARAGAIAALVAGTVAACGSSGASHHASASATTASRAAAGSTNAGGGSGGVSNVTLRIGDQAGTGAQAVLTAAGLIDKLPFKVHWADFTSGPPMLQAMGSGSVDVGDVGNAPPAFVAAGGAKISLIGAQRNSPGFSALLVPKGSSITSVSQLKGKRIAAPQGSSSNYHVLVALKRAGLSPHDVTIDYMQPAEVLAALNSHRVDAADLWQPFVQQAVAQQGAKVLLNAQTTPGNDSYTVASQSALADPSKKAALRDYLKILNRAYRWAGTHPQAWAKTWAKATGLPPSIMVTAAKNAVYTPIPITKSVIAGEQTVADTFYSAGLVPNKVDFGQHAYTGFNSVAGSG